MITRGCYIIFADLQFLPQNVCAFDKSGDITRLLLHAFKTSRIMLGMLLYMGINLYTLDVTSVNFLLGWDMYSRLSDNLWTHDSSSLHTICTRQKTLGQYTLQGCSTQPAFVYSPIHPPGSPVLSRGRNRGMMQSRFSELPRGGRLP